jgi:L-2-hydroxyglutarate oxidase LhgO
MRTNSASSEPHVAGFKALQVPESAVIDFHAVLDALADDVRAKGGEVLLGERVDSVDELPAREAAARVLVRLRGRRIARRGTPSCDDEWEWSRRGSNP